MRLHLLLAILLFAFATACAPEPAKPKKQRGYNVVLVIVDDLNDWVSPLGGHPQTKTPNLDRLAAQSLTFANAYCAAPTCNPSRVSLLTGVQPFNSGVYANPDNFRNAPRLKNAQTLPQLFRQNGYVAYSTGKVFQTPTGPRADVVSWTMIRPEEGNALRNSKNVTQNTLANSMNYQNPFELLLDWEEQEVDMAETSDFKNTAWAAAQIRETKTPFFIACGIYKPHLPWYLPKGSFAFGDAQSMIPPSFYNEDLNDLPAETEHIIRSKNPRSDYHRLTKANKQQEAQRAYLAAIHYADACLGNILDAIETNGDSTILIVLGDHGWHLGEKQHYRKFTLWERATHVPLFIRLPKAQHGGMVVQEFVSFIDLYPTIAAYCNLALTAEVDGEDVSYLFQNPETINNRKVVTTLDSGSVAVRYKNWRYIKYAAGGEELYNHQTDKNEWYNLARDPKYRSKMDSLQPYLPKKYQKPLTKKGHIVFDY